MTVESQNSALTSVAMSEMFFDSFGRLPDAARKQTQLFLTRFRRLARDGKLALEPILNAAVPAYLAAGVSDTIRLILNRSETGSVALLLYVGEKEDAFRWARTHVCRLNPATGAIQVYETLDSEGKKKAEPGSAEEKEGEAAPSGEANAEKKTSEAPAIFREFSDEDLLKAGVPEERLAAVRAVTSREELDRLRSKLPADAYESLVWLADGEPLDEVLEAYGFPRKAGTMEDALRSDRTRRAFRVVESDEDLKEIANASLERWRVFLHPMQYRLVHTQKTYPMLVRGAAGTGKTVVALHRAVELVSRPDWKSDEKLLFTTFTKNLAVDIESMLATLTSSRPALMKRIEVINIDGWVANFLARSGVTERLCYPGQEPYEKAWNAAMLSAPEGLKFDPAFYSDEWKRVILPLQVLKESDYLHASRKGRGVSLSRTERKRIWPVFEEMRYELSRSGLMTIEDGCFTALQLLREAPGMLNYGAVIVDEAQDMGSAALRLLARVATRPDENEPRIFLCGDGEQRIYSRTASLSACGISVRGRRSTRLRVAYRTTEEIRRTAESVLKGRAFDDMDEGTENLKGNVSFRHGASPVVFAAPVLEDEVSWISERIRELLSTGEYKDRDICVVARTKKLLDSYAAALKEKGFNENRLTSSRAEGEEEGVRFGTMHRVKGLEFKAVFIAGAGDGIIPLDTEEYRDTDPVERRLAELTERSLFYVAASRAKNALFISCSGKPGAFMVAMLSSERPER